MQQFFVSTICVQQDSPAAPSVKQTTRPSRFAAIAATAKPSADADGDDGEEEERASDNSIESGSADSDGSSSGSDSDESTGGLLGEVNQIHAIKEEGGKTKVLVSYKGQLYNTALEDRSLENHTDGELSLKAVNGTTGFSHREDEWVSEEAVRESKKQLLQNFLAKHGVTGEYTDENGFLNGINPDWLRVEKIIGQRQRRGNTEYLVKWCSIGYGESTWETEEDIKEDQ
eukprot:scaffold209067_cov52-Prasinocladus_malaysianus.AAC.1